MSKEEKKSLVPRLRFPEFREAGEWEEKKIEEVATFLKGKGISKSDVIHGGAIPCIRYGELYTFYKEKIDIVVSYTNLSKDQLVLSKANDVIIPASGETKDDIATASCVMKSGIALGGDLNIIRTKINGIFLSYYLNHAKKKEISQLAQGNSVVHLYPGQLQGLKINIPAKNEQQKVAATLTTLDDLIAAQAQKLKALQAHKKGLMQEVFPAEGEKVPRRRFREFEGAGEWEEKTLGDAGSFINGRAYKQEEFLEKGKYRVLRVGNFFTNNHWYYSDLELEEDKYCNKGDLLYAWSASFGPRIWNDEKVIYHYHIWKVVEKKGIDKHFLFLLLEYETERIKSQQANGLGLLHITKSAIESWESYIPKQKKEQQKIAAILTSIDNLIAAQTQKIDALKAHKKGLMQQLFPDPNEITT